MTSEPLFSIIMAAYNAAATIEAAIDSALAQTHGDFELVIVDDGSTDATAAIVAAYAERDGRVRVITQANAGANAARNRAIREAHGRYITFLDSDDLKLPTYLEAVARAIEVHPDAVLLYTDAWILDDRTRRIYRRGYIRSQAGPEPPPDDPEAFAAAMVERCFAPFSGTTLHRQTVADVGYFDPAIAGADDLDLWIRMVLPGHRAVRVPGRLAVMRRIEGQISGNMAVMRANLRALYLKIATHPEASAAIRRQAEAKADEFLPEPEPEPSRRPAWVQRAHAHYWRARIAVTWPRAWRATLPAELRSAFPNLRVRG